MTVKEMEGQRYIIVGLRFVDRLVGCDKDGNAVREKRLQAMICRNGKNEWFDVPTISERDIKER